MKTNSYVLLTRDEKGFSLIEVIVVLTVASVMFTMMFVYLSRSMLDSTLPVTNLVKSLELTQTAERLTAHYREDTADLDTIKANLKDNPSLYGTGFSVDTNTFIIFTPGGNDLYITDNESDENKKILKIKIRQDQTNETLTLLFTRH